MFINIILALSLGILSGIITGLIPGIHVNLITFLILSLTSKTYLNKIILSVYITALATTHTFLDSIPSIYLGAPDSSMILSALPGHKLLLKGKGESAVFFTVIGSLFSLISFLILIPILLQIFTFFNKHLTRKIIPLVIILIIAYIILKGKNKLKSLFIFLASGILGIIVLNFKDNYLMPLLSGMFGISPILLSLKQTKLPKQEKNKEKIRLYHFKISFIATIVASITAFLPGVGTAHSAILAQQILKTETKDFLVLTGSMNTANIAISFITLYVLGKARNGAVLAISDLINISKSTFYLLLISILISGSVASILTLTLAKKITNLIKKINYKKLMISIIILIFLTTITFTKLIGLMILVSSTSLGLITQKKEITRNNLLGCIIIPTICYFLQ